MDDVEFIPAFHGDGTAHHGVTGHFFQEVGAIFPGKFVFLTVLDAEILHLPAAFLLHDGTELLRIDIREHIGADMDEFYLVQEILDRGGNRIHRHVARINDGGRFGIFVTRGRRHHEQGLHPVVCQAFDDTVAGRPESSGDMRRELPTKHQHSHFISSL